MGFDQHGPQQSEYVDVARSTCDFAATQRLRLNDPAGIDQLNGFAEGRRRGLSHTTAYCSRDAMG
jgi:hypothetical protein